MELWVEHLEHGLANVIALLQFVLEAIAAAAIFIGLVRTGQKVMVLWHRRRRHRSLDTPMTFNQLRLTFGLWLALALEFQLGADILSTTITPNFEALANLAAIALIRTFLNFFLNKELEAEAKYQERTGDRSTLDSSEIP
ncbi:MAG: DUF1622 domain-containing protein [Leptolyngbyaceae bacterium]|nr:DUF1622 domain-containing protein [Leptolyngbyaceae bacterium]